MDRRLEELRKQISELDLKLAPLLVNRLDIVSKITKVKKLLNLEIKDINREEELNHLLATNGFNNSELIDLFNKIRLFFKERQCYNKIALIGKNLTHSFSHIVHQVIAKLTNLDYKFEYIDIDTININNIYTFLEDYKYKGFFITMPYKKELITNKIYLSYTASKVGSINILYLKNNIIIGDNTDYFGFINSFDQKREFIDYTPFILGDGASADVVKTALVDSGYKEPIIVSLKPNNKAMINYDMFNLLNPKLVINTTPVGMYPNTNEALLKTNTKLVEYYFDLIYNPKKTKNTSILPKNTVTKNGIEMLVLQAIKGIEIIYDISINKDLYEKIIKEVLAIYDTKVK